MRELSKKPRTEAQIAAVENLAKASKMSSKKYKLVTEAKKYIENDLIVIDTETTDLDGEVIQICAASSRSGEVIFESLVKSEKPITQGAFDKHGFSDEDIKDAPSFEQIATELGETIGHRKWASFNIQFDLDALLNSRHNKEADCYKWITENCSHYCLMKLAAEIYGSTNSYGSISLADAMHYSGSKWRGRAHDATADTLAATDVLKAIAKNDS
ncbi:3'-5' exonuclease DinG [Allocatenococcus thiocycli]|nr:3'-5' exonuclease DinG [Catenococcus thiocycli]